MPEIIVKLGDKIVQKVLLMQNQRLTVGRAPDNDIAIENPAVSRRHTSIQQINGRYILEDLNSANGTYVNGVRVSKTEILDRDVITIGKHKLHFYNEVAAGAAGAGSDEKAVPAGAAPTAVLRITQGKQRDQVFELTKVETTIGRAQENDVRLHDWFVSKFHAVIGRRGGQFIIRDLDSWRHTMVNGEVVQERALQSGDEIMFGLKTAMRFELKGASSIAPEGSGRLPVEIEGGAEAPAEEAVDPPSGIPEPVRTWEDHEAPINMAMAAVDDHGKAGPPPAFLSGMDDEFEVKVDDFELHHTPEQNIAEGTTNAQLADPEASAPEAPSGSAPQLGAASSDEIAMWEKALQNPSRVIRKQAARALKKLTGRDYDIE